MEEEKSLLITKEDIDDLFFNVIYSTDMDNITRQFENDIIKIYHMVDNIPSNAFGEECSETEDKSSLARALVSNLESKYFCRIAKALKEEVEEWINKNE